MSSSTPARSRWTLVTWLICFIASIGFAFDIYELLMLPLIVRPALLELGNIKPGTAEFRLWLSLLFYVPAVAGGVFGLLGGYLTDRLGRRAVLTWSILLYAFSAFAAGYSTNLYMLLVFRCFVFVGVCVEFVAAVAWLAELFDDHREREGVLGFTQAFSSFGGLLVAIVNGMMVAWAANQPAPLLLGLHLPAIQLPAIQLPGFLSFLGEIQNAHAPWRYTLMSGLVPAIPLILIRPFLPESPAWQKKRTEGTLRRPSVLELFSPKLRFTTLIVTLMFTCSFGAAFGAIQQIPQIVPDLPEVKQEAAQATKDLPPPEAGPIRAAINQKHTAHVTKLQEVGGLVGRFLLAGLVLVFLSRRNLLRFFLLPGLIAMPLIFAGAGTTGLHYLEWGAFAAGLFTVAQFSFWGNYLPHVYPVHLRGTGESFAANIGGRLIGTSFAAVTQLLAAFVPGNMPEGHKVAYTAAVVAFCLYLVNFVGSFFLPEPEKGQIAE